MTHDLQKEIEMLKASKCADLIKHFRPILRRAKAMHKDCCRNSCRPGPHYQECLDEKVELEKASRAIRLAKV